MDREPQLYLASASPRRRDLLGQLGISYRWGAVDIDESHQPGEAPADLVRRLAVAKGRAARSPLPVLSADTIVTLDDAVFGKPASRDDALAMLDRLSGRCHEVMTAVALSAAGRLEVCLSVSEVRFREIHPDEALAYWHSGEPRDKAGAYAIQGRGAVFVESLRGSYSGVVGLPVFETAGLLKAAGIEVLGT